jgi:hypothetical protein
LNDRQENSFQLLSDRRALNGRGDSYFGAAKARDFDAEADDTEIFDDNIDARADNAAAHAGDRHSTRS